jgi:methanogenic corrinoid protein MtbC1
VLATPRRGRESDVKPEQGISDPGAPTLDGAVRTLTKHAGRGDEPGVQAAVDRLLVDDGWSLDSVVSEVLAGVQRGVGVRWQTGEWTIAREHAATATIDAALTRLDGTPPASDETTTLALVCAEGEWHTTPAYMAATLFRRHGWRVVFLGASVPPGDLKRELRTVRPAFVAISCTYPLALSGAARTAAVARQLDIPTIGGGHAFGTSAGRAHHLGLDGWAPSVAEASRTLARWVVESPASGGDSARRADIESLRPLEDLESLEERWAATVEDALPDLTATLPSSFPADRRLDRQTRQDLVDLLHAAQLTGICEDPTLFAEHARWLRTLSAAAGLRPDAVYPSIDILRDHAGRTGLADRDIEPLRPEASATTNEEGLAEDLAAVARELVAAGDVETTLQRIVDLAVATIDGCDHAGLSLVVQGHLETPAQSDPVPEALDRLQDRTRQGPCLDAIRDEEVYETGDLASERRWPSFATQAVEETAVRSVLAIRLFVEDDTLGALNLYAASRDAFDDHDRTIASIFAAHASVALHAVSREHHLAEALDTRDVIGQAKGIIMAREGVDEQAAFQLLRVASSRTHTKLRELAARIARGEP